jgi:MGT family glycosyltransferase
MKFIIASPPFTGHLNPMLSIARTLIAGGHEVVVTTGTYLRKRVEAAGARFVPLLPGADFENGDMNKVHPEHSLIPPGPARVEAEFGDNIIEPMPYQYEGLRQILETFKADAIIADALFTGTLPFLFGPRAKRPVIIHSNPSMLVSERDDGAPGGMGFPPAETDAQLEEYRAARKVADRLCLDLLKARADRLLAQYGLGPSTMPLFDVITAMPDAFIQATVPGFEYPRRNLPSTVRFVGCLPVPPSNLPDPDWIGDLDGSRKVVLVTQGTYANFDLGQLIAPTLAALANEPDVLVVATTGGRPVSEIPGNIPGNARLAEFLPFERLLAKVDVAVTNGGYGTVSLALKAGIPLVVAGLTEDKADITTRVAWSGAGINLAVNEPTPDAVRDAVRAVLDKPTYREHARRLAAEFAAYDTPAEVLRLVEGCVRAAAAEVMDHSPVMAK